MSQYWSDFVHQLEPYVPGEQPTMSKLVKLNTNEHPLGPSPKVIDAIREQADERLRLYPDPDSRQLKQAIADYYSGEGYGIQREQVFVGNGSDEVLAHLFLGFFKQDKPLLFPDITYSFYKVYCGLYQIDYQAVPLDDELAIAVDDYLKPNGGIIFPNPNAPTGRLLPLGEIERLLQANTDSLVVVDEAYIDFSSDRKGGDSAIALVNRYPNLLVTQTLSKSRSLAGLRIGLAVGDAALIDGLNRIKDSFNSYPLDRLAIAAGVAAFEDRAWFEKGCTLVIEQRDWLATQLAERGFQSLPSAANFLFTRHPQHSGAALAGGLREQGVIVRHFGKPARIADYLRITVGTAEQNQALIAALDTLL
ncbi:histidinol-phosphate aminotransferase [Alcanivorax hongdengensis A-11-3]|uniref:Histidinol-phosphate aminotransferase n=1 Tax=Alcanivorax hongdengensis A-11-3 TaxID=1177179 RepID=L0WBN4_9GAMM|nr:histidinol-phosphate transaminase [Alcanivorax hongdengensis]EKF74188.1 histidinol-phosphate aminotransferase [Alcanivorax hongdengensis A-11-3]